MSITVTELPSSATPPRETVLTALEEAYRRIAGDARFLVSHGGRVSEVSPSHYSVRGLSETARLGDLVSRRGRNGGAAGAGEVVRIARDGVVVAPYERAGEVGLGEAVFNRGPLSLAPGPSWRGRVVDALGRPADGGPAPAGGPVTTGQAPVTPPAMQRQRVSEGFRTGVRVIDIFTPLCHGQRLGVFAGSGVGKSTLLSMLANADAFDTVVIALVGERGREVREFLEDTIGPQGMAKSVAVVATSDESAMMRRRAPDTAMSIAEYFRDRGDRVLLIVDSITRFAHALREVSIGAGEPPVARGYPASVFTELPRLLERAGPGETGSGSITAILSVLVDGDDHNDPVADAVRGILDGHVVLDRAIAEQGRFPPVNPLASISRLADRAWTPDEKRLVTRLRAMIARFEDTRDIRLLGAYQPGHDPELDQAVRQIPLIYDALTQSPNDQRSADPFTDLAMKLKAGEPVQ
ncbi:MAG: flagellar protein export ATPase FliI [Nitratireductor sp.]|nr:flagellar protein export ATPase FliI [Nitratireductor sp.]